MSTVVVVVIVTLSICCEEIMNNLIKENIFATITI